MLTLTDTAADAVKSIVAKGTDATTGGLRIHSSDEPGTGFALSLVGAPEEQDAVVEEGGARVFLDGDANIALDDQVLDAQVDDAGGVRFALAAQA